jgi:hypothetical protein
MAILAVTNRLLYHVETLADLEALGSDDGITADTIAYIESTKTWSRPRTISASSTIWTSTPSVFPEGLPDGLVYYMDAGNRASFPDASASSIYDLVQNSGTGTLSGVAVTDSHLNFDGANDFISFSKNSNLDDLFQDGGGGATILAWVRPESSGDAKTIASTRGSGGNDGWALRITSTDTVQFLHDWDSVDFSTASVASLPLNQWALVGYSGDANGGSIWLNGRANTGTGFGGTGTQADDTGNDIYLGYEESAVDPFDGDIDVVMMWDRQLTAGEVAQVYKVMRDRFVEQGMVLIDTVTVTSGGGATSITFDGLNGNQDGTYYLVGRLSSAGGISLEARPNGLTTNLASVVEQGSTTSFTSTTGWLLFAWIIPEGAGEGTGMCSVSIYPEENKGGSSSTRSGRRMYTGTTTIATGTTPTTATTETYTLGGWWNEASTNMSSLDIVATVGAMEQGTSFSLYYIEDAG